MVEEVPVRTADEQMLRAASEDEKIEAALTNGKRGMRD